MFEKFLKYTALALVWLFVSVFTAFWMQDIMTHNWDGALTGFELARYQAIQVVAVVLAGVTALAWMMSMIILLGGALDKPKDEPKTGGPYV